MLPYQSKQGLFARRLCLGVQMCLEQITRCPELAVNSCYDCYRWQKCRFWVIFSGRSRFTRFLLWQIWSFPQMVISCWISPFLFLPIGGLTVLKSLNHFLKRATTSALASSHCHFCEKHKAHTKDMTNDFHINYIQNPPPFVDLGFWIPVLSEYYSHTCNHLKYEMVWFPQFESLSVLTPRIIRTHPQNKSLTVNLKSISWGVRITCYCTRTGLYSTTCTHPRDKNMTDDLISPHVEGLRSPVTVLGHLWSHLITGAD